MLRQRSIPFNRARKAGAGAVALLALVVVQVALAGEPVDRPNAADVKRAKSSLVRLSDLDKYHVDRKLARAPQIPRCANYPGDRSDITITGFASSSFMYYNDSISSAALFFKTFADGDRYWQKTVRTAFVQCLASKMNGSGAKQKVMSAKQITIGPTTADRAVAYRMITRVTLPTLKPHYWVETTVFVKYGRGIAVIRIVDLDHVCACYTNIASGLTSRLVTASRG
jgi:hypothetical protein